MATQIFSTAALKHYATMVVTGLIVLISAIVFTVQGAWALVGICLVVLLTVLLPQLIEYWTTVRMAVNLQIQYALLLVLGPYLGGTLGLYRIWEPWDTIVHFYSGIPVSFAIIAALGIMQHRYRLALPVWFEVIVLLAVKAFVALTWEIGEFFFDLIFETNTQADNFDTMTDMIAGLTPALLIAAGLVLHRRNGMFPYIGSLLEHPARRRS